VAINPMVGNLMHFQYHNCFRLDRCIAAQTRKDQVLFPIIQGGLDLDLRQKCTKEMLSRVKVGIAIGGKKSDARKVMTSF
jgi:queuine tRNA-ribosyltransferase